MKVKFATFYTAKDSVSMADTMSKMAEFLSQYSRKFVALTVTPIHSDCLLYVLTYGESDYTL